MRLLSSVIYAAFVIISISSIIYADEVTCSVSSNTSKTENCTVRFDQVLKLDCGNHTGGVWFKDGSNHSVCANDQCILKDMTFTKDSGMYYCKVSDNEKIIKYKIQLIVEAPPEFHSFGDQHTSNHGGINTYPEVAIEVDELHGKLEVEVVGIGPFNVTWHHNSTTIGDACSSDYVTCNDKKLNDTTIKFNYTITNTGDWAVNGYYYANVTNPYGSSLASIKFKIQCGAQPSNVLTLKPVDSFGLLKAKTGDKAKIDCFAEQAYLNVIGICYGYQNESFSNIFQQVKTRCSICVNDDENCSAQISNKTQWVSRRYSKGSCNDQHGVILELREVQKSDNNLLFFCYYHNSLVNRSFGYYKLEVETRSYQLIIIIGGCVSGCILILTGIIFTLCLTIRHRKSRRKERNSGIEEESDVRQQYPTIQVDGVTVSSETSPLLCNSPQPNLEYLSTISVCDDPNVHLTDQTPEPILASV